MSSYKKRFAAFCSVLMLIAAGACTSSPQDKEARYLKRGQAQMAKKDYSRAALEFRSATQAMPNDAEPQYQLGLAYLASGNPNAAVAGFRQAIRLNPKHAGAQLKLAEMMAASRNRDLMSQAATRLQDLVSTSPDNLEASDALALTQMQLGKPEEAAKLMETTLGKFPQHLQASVVLARLKLKQNDLSGAEDVLKKAVATAPQSVPAALALAQLYLALRQAEKAEPEIRRALTLDPKNVFGLLALGAIQLSTNRTAEAEQTYKLLAATPDKRYKSAHAIFLYRTGKVDVAIGELQGLNKENSDDRDIRSALFAVYLKSNRAKEAENLLATSLRRNPKDTDALMKRSSLLLKAGKAAEADQDLQQVLRLQPDLVDAHLARASVLRAEGLSHFENQELEKALQLQPGSLAARLGLVRNYLSTNKAKSALELLDHTPSSQRGSPVLVTFRIWALLGTGETKEAKETLDRALAIQRAPELVLQSAVLKMRQRDYSGARLDAEEVLKANPEDVRAARLVVGGYAGEHEDRKAVQRLNEMVAYRPKSAPLQSLLGEWYVNAGNLAEARKAFEAAKNADPAYLPSDLSLAGIDLRDMHADAARDRLRPILAANPTNVPALLLSAQAERAAGSSTEEIARYRSVLAIDDSNPIALNNLAYELATVDPEEALKLAQRVVELAPENPSALDTLGWVYYRKGVYGTAISYLKSAVEKGPSARRQFHLAVSYLKSGQKELGQQLLNAALKQDPNLLKTEQGW